MVDENDSTIPVEAVYPYTDYDAMNESDDAPSLHEHLEEKANITAVHDVTQTVHGNGIDREKAIWFGKRMASLIYHGGLAMSAAKAKAARDTLRSGRSLDEVADLIGMTRGGLSKLSGDAAVNVGNARRLRYMTFERPMNLIFDFHIAAESPADYETRYVLLEVVNPRTEPVEEGGVRPNPRVAPPEPQYGLIKEVYAPGSDFNPSADPENRTWGTFQEMKTVWFVDEEEVVDYLYEERYFWTEERGQVWKEQLEKYGFETDIDPKERINPDAIMDE